MRARSVLCVLGSSSLLLGFLATSASAAPNPNIGRCVSELAQAGLVGRDLNPAKVNIILGTEGDDVFDSMVTDGVDVICGFGGSDSIDTLDAGDVFLGGDDRDSVRVNNGTFIAGNGDDVVVGSNNGTFIGGEGRDLASFNDGFFDGGAGDDQASFNDLGAVFNGGDGNEFVVFNDGTFNGGPGDDSVIFNTATGVFNGGPGNDTVQIPQPGSTFIQ